MKELVQFNTSTMLLLILFLLLKALELLNYFWMDFIYGLITLNLKIKKLHGLVARGFLENIRLKMIVCTKLLNAVLVEGLELRGHGDAVRRRR